MFIWGQRNVYRKKGYVADYCSICRSNQPHKVVRIGLAFHLYYITFTEGALRGHRRTCDSCKTASDTDVDMYTGFHDGPAPIDVLMQHTYPDLNEVVAARLALEHKVLHTPGQLTAQERREVLFAPFLALSPQVEKRYETIHLDLVDGFSIVGSIALLMVIPSVSRFVAPGHDGEIMLGTVVLVAVFIVYQLATGGARFMRRKIIPHVADVIRPLRPSDDELHFILNTLKQHKHKMGKKLKVKELIEQLERTPN